MVDLEQCSQANSLKDESLPRKGGCLDWLVD